MVGFGANKGLEVHRQTVGLVCHLEAEVFLCPLVDEATRLASAPCSKHNQGRRNSSEVASRSITGSYCLSHEVDGRAMWSSRCTAASRDKQTRYRAWNE